MRIARTLGVAVAALTLISTTMPAAAQQSIGDKQAKARAQIPVCTRRLGTLTVAEPENKWWVGLGLESPEALIKVLVSQSGCFTTLDRGRGFELAQRERELAGGGALQQGSNIGGGQVRAADFILVPDIVSKNANSGGTNIGGALAGMFGGPLVGAIVGGISLNSSTADVILSLTNVRTSEQQAMAEGHGAKTDLGFGLGGGLFGAGGGGALGASNYSKTAIGQVVTLAYIDAYSKLVTQMGGLEGASQAAPSQTVSTTAPGRLYSAASPSSSVVKTVTAGTLLYPTGNKTPAFWEVKDELGNVGWVSSQIIELAK